MHSTPRQRRLTAAALTALAVTVGATACSSGSGSTGAKDADSGTYTVWDPYPQFAKGSAWTKLLDKCGTDAGVKIKRTGFDTSDLANKTLLAAQQGNSPDVLIVDNPVVSTLAEAGVLTTTEDNKLDTSKADPNLLAAGQSGGKTYGTPIGANTLALYYNKEVLKKAGVDIASVKDWKSLTAALAKVRKAGKKGITFSAIGTEEGSFQFLPWFWGAGAQLTALDSPQSVSALSLWKGWLDKGYAPNSVLNNTQTTSWQEFATGDYAFSENGTWQLANAEKAGFDYGVIPVPATTGGNAAAPTGGEFVTVPVQKDTGRYATSQKLVTCLTSTDNLYDTDTTLSYVAPTAEVQDKQVAANAALKPWVEAVKAAKGRTSDDLGTKYPKISEQLWKAVQSALSGAESPKDALAKAQSAVK
ncbi:sugar ABC transporter substrate-binding protein [Streptomyces scabiei]|uniref:sugar ABC transporter substrate-binding protein n=1 Tax=Streptomyces scabiei TaxID=1930 RepID=UPI001B339376|nr:MULTISPECIES: sugar ABC transporter substrate-binding protein [Streptomyces]MBP5889125.1 sugar ABC transporter substrate-binding protein [Streptomyces sp. LBUM 1481]MBP5919145.1 sugar ABC transporter substrate-binding protein [Streptomyces sp. LBUM 1483]MDX2691448.1 sugar ABC transporter substrate-binding protein [Streptomyces scabiei]MDX2754605.1 sugar ABC transporter substrate-binding protein [Streptomyces scabiei]MDX2808744.1 sugar ABC transporter substrate-binding protein [Streptomyces 